MQVVTTHEKFDSETAAKQHTLTDTLIKHNDSGASLNPHNPAESLACFTIV